jgi:hypothetical protein
MQDLEAVVWMDVCQQKTRRMRQNLKGWNINVEEFIEGLGRI